MKAYLVITGLLFALLAAAHAMRTIEDYPKFVQQPVMVLEGPGIGLVALALCVWAWRLLWPQLDREWARGAGRGGPGVRGNADSGQENPWWTSLPQDPQARS